MREKRNDSVDFVKDFQEYLTQQTQHVNMISGSVCNEKEPELLQPAGTENHQNGIHHASVEVSLDDGSGMIGEGPERTADGKLKCQYCNYASKGIARLMEHTRMHTGEKPHRCHLCPFASAYERHLEAHMRSHRGEKPYQCELCPFRCSDQSNLSHHRRRRHKLLPMKGRRASMTNKRMMGILQKRSSYSLSYGRRPIINFSPPPMLMQKTDYLDEFSHSISAESYEALGKAHISGISKDVQDMVDNPLNRLSALAGQFSSLAHDVQTPASSDMATCRDEKPFVIQQCIAPTITTVVSSVAQSSSNASPDRHPVHNQRNFSPVAGPNSERSAHMSSPCMTNSQPSTPTLPVQVQDPQLLHHCQHCDMYFADNILYTIHMGCHGYENPFQCNICGCKCKNQYDFACHFARGQHKQI
ncbi:zinc finger protein Pegasus isoform X1 [Amblyraja radiata]|uniref:zinc finger protein Pegasus isoform X1 n=1 Tax=Amblyraja radiata TaxID=386614 RepID=UPI00140279E3|nr:zinc finger protein Pegasus isoform X1 [Amblyraja radiata]